ncbi:MAG: hypothetical protein ACFFDW_13895 [Candidatus Thorarchaeota archaeon]
MSHYYKFYYCIFCGEPINFIELVQIHYGICLHCNNDTLSPFSKYNENTTGFKYKSCNNCSSKNPLEAIFCGKCGSKELIEFTDQEHKIRSFHREFFKTRTFTYMISFFISILISIGLVLGIAIKYLVVKNIVAIMIILSFAFVISWFIFVFLEIIKSKK